VLSGWSSLGLVDTPDMGVRGWSILASGGAARWGGVGHRGGALACLSVAPVPTYGTRGRLVERARVDSKGVGGNPLPSHLTMPGLSVGLWCPRLFLTPSPPPVFAEI